MVTCEQKTFHVEEDKDGGWVQATAVAQHSRSMGSHDQAFKARASPNRSPRLLMAATAWQGQCREDMAATSCGAMKPSTTR